MNDNQESSRTGSRALIAVVAGFVVGAVLAWIYWVQHEEQTKEAPSQPTLVERVRLELGPEEPATERDEEPEDLTRIEGIGPRVSSVLNEAGIATYRQLAESDVEALQQILRDAGLQFMDPTTWPEQAALAASGDWDTLAARQEELSAGRRAREG